MIGLLEGMLVPQPKVTQAAAAQQSAPDCVANAEATTETAIEAGFLSVLCQMMVGQTPQPQGELPLLPESETATKPEAAVIDSGSSDAVPQLIVTPEIQLAAQLVPFQNRKTASFPFTIQTQKSSVETLSTKSVAEEKGIEINLVDKTSSPETDGQLVGRPAVIPELSLKQRDETTGVEITQRAKSESKTETEPRLNSNPVGSATRMSEPSRETNQVVRPERAAMHAKADPPDQVRHLETKHQKENVTIITTVQRKELPRASGISAPTPESVAELKTVADKFAVVLPLGMSPKSEQSPKRKDAETPIVAKEQILPVLTETQAKQIVNTSTKENELPLSQTEDNSFIAQEKITDENTDQQSENTSDGDVKKEFATEQPESKAVFEFDAPANQAKTNTVKPASVEPHLVSVVSKSEMSLPTQEAHKTPATLPRIPEDFGKNLMVKLSDELKLQVEGKSSEVRVMMKPESLGEMSLRVTMHEGKLVAVMDVTQSAVKNALEAQLPQMREALSAQGIDIHRFEINSGTETHFQQPSEGSAFYQKQRSKRHTEVDTTDDAEGMKYLGYNTVEYII